MKCKFLIFIFILLIINYTFIGCVSTKNYKNNILGSWITKKSAGQEETAIFNFFSNGSYSFIVNIKLNESDINTTSLSFWGTYIIGEELITMEIEGNLEKLSYSFSEDNKELKIIEENGDFTELIKQ